MSINVRDIDSAGRFIPTTREIEIAKDVVYRPLRTWHTGIYAGEKLTNVNGDSSGCVRVINGIPYTNVPYTVTHRAYWSSKNPNRVVSAFLSYPNGMGLCDSYFWEALIGKGIRRFVGPRAEIQMEKAIVRFLSKVKPK